MAPAKPTWRNTLQKTTAFGHITDHAEIAVELGYPYILWNHRVYRAYTDEGGNVTAEDMYLTIDDLK